MNNKEAQVYKEKRQRFLAALKRSDPTIVSVLETSDERSRLDREENRRRRVEAFRKRAEKRAKR